MTNKQPTDYDDSTVIEAVKHCLKRDFRIEEEEIEEVEITHKDKYLHVRVTVNTGVNVFRNSMPSYLQNLKLGDRMYDFSVVAEPEELGLEG